MTREVETIDQVIERLTEIVEEAKADRSRSGYFAALYRKVTIRVQRGIREGFFDDRERMERFDVIFARRYLDAFDEFQAGGRPSRSWLFAFEATEQWWPIVLQHLLLGMNAHINVDLGVAAAETVEPDRLADLHGDFNKINVILSELVGGVEEELARIWTMLRLLDRFLGDVDEAIIKFSMDLARDSAWSLAQRLSPMNEAERTHEIARADGETLELSRLIRSPGIVGGVVTRAISSIFSAGIRRADAVSAPTWFRWSSPPGDSD